MKWVSGQQCWTPRALFTYSEQRVSICTYRAHYRTLMIRIPHHAAYMRRRTWSALIQVMACRLFGAKPLPEPINAHLLLIEPLGTNLSENRIEIQKFSFNKMHLKMSSAKWRPFCPRGDDSFNSSLSGPRSYDNFNRFSFQVASDFNIPLPPWTKWTLFRRQYFQTSFHEWNVPYFDSNFTEFCS